MQQIYLGLVLHNHQPVGNFPSVFEQVYHDSYLPMIEALERHSSVRLSLHYTGALLDWLREHRPELIQRIRQLVSRGQIEIVTGGYYEPVLPAIPEADSLGQIAKLNLAIGDDFGYQPRGLWLAERVWEPQLTQILASAAIDWTLVDDTHFRLVGLGDEDLFGYYVTEEGGRTLKVFGTSKHLRYLIPWHSVTEIIDYLRDQATAGSARIVVMGDDGEKFGSWPGTFAHCWQEGWMEAFFTALEENRSWLKTTGLSEYANSFPPLGRIYLPCASYDEMLEWSLPSPKTQELESLLRELKGQDRHDILQYMHSGFWRNFMVKYPEINNMHKKMLRVHDKVYRARKINKADCGTDELWQGQCNCPYWHGVFGGIYMTDIRAATYSHLIQAEKKADAVLHQGPWLECDILDFDCDGGEELLVEGNAAAVYIDPARGGSIFEWDLRHRDFNLASTLTRRPEAYHNALTETHKQQNGGEARTIHDEIRIKEPGLQHHLHYDSYRRACLIDHFLDNTTTLKKFAHSSHHEIGDFVEQPYRYRAAKSEDRLSISLDRDGRLRLGRTTQPFRVAKKVILQSGNPELYVKYTLTNTSDVTIASTFGTEWNINLLGGGHNDQAYYHSSNRQIDDRHLDSTGELTDIDELILGNRYLDIAMQLTLTQPVRIWRFPVETICNSESGLGRVYQGSCLLILLPFTLAPGSSIDLGLTWTSL